MSFRHRNRTRAVRIVAIVVVVVLSTFGVFAVSAQDPPAPPPGQDLITEDATGSSFVVQKPYTVSDYVTTGVPTTTGAPSTTTTAAPTTTTGVPPTTTTTDPGVVLGPDPASPNNNQICQPAENINDNCHWDVYFGAAHNEGTPRTRLLEAPYSWRSALGLPLWFPGTRDGYRIQWQFLECDGQLLRNDPTTGLLERDWEGRTAFRMGYGAIQSFQIGDRGGNEGVRMWDGTDNPQGGGRETNDGPRAPVQVGPNIVGPSRPPTFRLYDVETGEVCEVRDYELAEDFHSHGSNPFDPPHPNVKFAVDEDASTDETFTDSRAFITEPFEVYGEKVVVMYLDNVEAARGYYTSMDEGWEWDWEQE